MDEKIKDFRIKQRLLELDVDRFFNRLDFWSRTLAWVAIAGGVWIIARMIWRLSRSW